MWKNNLTIKEASELLNVSIQTLRNWDKTGKLTARRDPINKYRIYSVSEVEKLTKHTKRNKNGRADIQLIDK